MKIPFLNRFHELDKLNEHQNSPLVVLFGRRRVGKTELIKKWSTNLIHQKIYYSQAIEASEKAQIEQICEDLKGLFPESITISSWKEFLSLLTFVKTPCTIILDEFPYFIKTNPTVASQLQRWIDHHQVDHINLVILGSSQSMMDQIFLNSTSPLYERADLILHLRPLEYKYFCQAMELEICDPNSFELYSLVGGIPRYWKYAFKIKDPIALANKMYFGRDAYLENEPDRLLKDEDIHGMQAKTIFEIIGRGASKPSEIASKMEIHQTGLSKPLKILMNTHLIGRSIPFGENTRNSKKTLYEINDVAMAFWYGTYSPHRSRWHLYSQLDKSKLIHDHASRILEKFYLSLFPDAAVYWENNLEFDCVRFMEGNSKKIIISEIKHRVLSKQDRDTLENKVLKNYEQSKLKKLYPLGKIEILDTRDILNFSQLPLVSKYKDLDFN